MQNFIRISLEPDSPTKQDVENLEKIVQNIEEISIEKLQHMSGSQLKQIVKVLCEEAKNLSVVASKLPEIRETLNSKIEERRSLETESQNEIEKLKNNEQFNRRFLLVANNKQKLDLLIKGRVDLTVENEYVITDMIKSGLFEQLKLSKLFLIDDCYIYYV